MNSLNPEPTNEKILRVAAQLFAERGFAETSMTDIVRGTGLSKGAIYHHFDSKERILEEVKALQAKALNEMMEQWLAETQALNGKDRLRALLVKDIEIQEASVYNEITSLGIKSPDFIVSYMRDAIAQADKVIAPIIRQGVADGSLDVFSPDEAAEVFMLLLNIWCDPVIVTASSDKLIRRLQFLQHVAALIGLDVIDKSMLEKYTEILRKLYQKEVSQ